MVLHDWSVVTALMARGDVGLGETYVAGLWDTPSIEALIEVGLRQPGPMERYAFPGSLERDELPRHRPGDAGELAARGEPQHPGALRRRQRVLPRVARRELDLLGGAVRRGRRRRPPPRADAQVRPDPRPGRRPRAGARDRLRLGRLCRARGGPRACGDRRHRLAEPEGLCRRPPRRPRRHPAAATIAPPRAATTPSSRSR